MLQRFGNCFCFGVNLKLFVDLFNVAVDGIKADEEFFTDFLVA